MEEKKVLEDARREATEAKKRADEAEARAAAYEARQKQDAEAAKAQAHQALAARVAPVLKKDAAEIAKGDESTIMRDALKVMLPKLDASKMDAGALRGALEVAFAHEATRVDSATQIADAIAGVKKTTEKDTIEDEENASELAYQKSRQDAQNFWRAKK